MQSAGGIFSKPIPGFGGYHVTRDGRVVSLSTGKALILTPTQNGDLTVGLTKGGKQHRRSVKVLVAEAFVEGKDHLFDTPILLNGIKDDLRAENIMWRPRWFAWRYSHQFLDYFDWYFNHEVVEIHTDEVYEDILHASVFNGILCDDVLLSIHNDHRIFPTGQMYQYT